MPGDNINYTIDQFPWLFDIEELSKQIPPTDDLTSVIRGHLYLENVLISFLQQALFKPELLKIERINFITKVEICASLGILDTDTVRPILKLNSIRNQVAHNLHYAISHQECRDMFFSFTEKHRKYVSTDGKGAEIPPLARMIVGLILLVEFGRKVFLARKLKEKEAVTELQKAIEQANATLARPRNYAASQQPEGTK